MALLPNLEENYTRKGLSVRFFTDEAHYHPLGYDTNSERIIPIVITER